LIIVGVGISNYIDEEVKKEMAVNPEAQEIAKKWSVETDKLLGICLPLDTSKDGLTSLQQCKTKFQDIQNNCKDELFSKTDFCLNTDFQKLDESFDQRITMVEGKIQALEQKVEDLKKQSEALESAKPEFNADVFEFANDSVLGYLDYCMEYPSERCTEDAKEMLRLCSIDASVKACSDPRMKEIAIVEMIEQTTGNDPNDSPSVAREKMTPDDYYLSIEYARIVRDCVSENSKFDEAINNEILNLDSIDLNDEDYIQNNLERLSICSSDIREIETGYCNWFEPSCTETGKFEMYWEVMPKLQSSFDTICIKFDKFCGLTFKDI
jgi:hypothetical protein